MVAGSFSLHDKSADGAGNQDFNQLLVDSLPFPVMLINKDRIVLAANRNAQEMGVIEGKFCWDTFGRMSAITMEERQRILQQGCPTSAKTACHFCQAEEALASGQRLHVEATIGDRLLDAYWQPVDRETYLHYCIDSNRQKTNRTITSQQISPDQLVKGITAGIAILDKETRITWNNGLFAKWFGHHPMKEFYDLLSTDTGDRECVARRAGRSGMAEQTEITLRLADGKDEYFLISATPVLNDNGQTEQIILTVLDITYLKIIEMAKSSVEMQLQQAMRMEAIGTLAGGIAHDFNNILGSILGYSEMACAELPPGSQPREDIEKVIKAGTRASHLVKQILAFSCQTEKQNSSVYIHHIIKEVLKLMRASFPANVRFEQAIAADCPPVSADPSEIHQLLINLCTNARHAMLQKGGILSLGLQRTTITSDSLLHHVLPSGDYVKLSIADTGIGIDPKVIDRIFDPFFTTKDIGQGTGLGLSVVHGIVKSHHGHIAVSSQPGNGTTFEIYLPALTNPRMDNHEIATIIPHGSERILLVDDEKDLVGMLDRILTDLGYTVTSFTRSPEAFACFLKNPASFDLLITDMAMPEMNGSTLAREVLFIRPRFPIILVTGYSELINEEESRQAGIRAFLMKPVIKRELAQVIRRVLDKEAGDGRHSGG